MQISKTTKPIIFHKSIIQSFNLYQKVVLIKNNRTIANPVEGEGMTMAKASLQAAISLVAVHFIFTFLGMQKI